MNAHVEVPTPWLTADATPVHEARVLTEGGSLARIVLDGLVYTLRLLPGASPTAAERALQIAVAADLEHTRPRKYFPLAGRHCGPHFDQVNQGAADG